MNEYDEKVHQLEAAAQRAGEEQMERAHASLDEDGDDFDAELVGPFCGCITCEVREILAAAWPHLRKLALLEVEPREPRDPHRP